MDKDIAKHLTKNYGTRALQVADIAATGDASLGKRLAHRHPVIAAEVVFAVEQEYALTAIDVLARRTRLAFLDANAARAATPEVVDIMARLLGWSAARKEQEVAKTLAFLETMQTLTGKPATPAAGAASAAKMA